MKKIFILVSIILSFFFMSVQAQVDDLPAYRLFDKDGEIVAYASLVDSCDSAHVVLFGELHNNPICHWIQLRLSKDIFASRQSDLVFGAEMFEADIQEVFNEYLNGYIKESHFTEAARNWPNYSTDYAPLVNFAKENSLPFIATNIARRYANMVARFGIEDLEKLAQEKDIFAAPLPFEVDFDLPGYKNLLDMMGGHGSQMSGRNFVYAQAVKDATMAHFILKNRKQNQIFLHFNGSYHSNNFEGIYWYLKEKDASLDIRTISSVEQTQLDSLEAPNQGLADFILAIPSDMTKTY